MDKNTHWIITRRTFLKSSVASLAGLTVPAISYAINGDSKARQRTARFGIVTDCHYADANTQGVRFYRESLDKLSECVALMNTEKVDFLIELGDFKDQDKPPAEKKTLSYLQAAEKMLKRFKGPTYHVLGNHDMDSISKKHNKTLYKLIKKVFHNNKNNISSCDSVSSDSGSVVSI